MKTAKLTNTLQDNRFELTSNTDFGDFLSLMMDDRRTANIQHDVLKHIFERVSRLMTASFATVHAIMKTANDACRSVRNGPIATKSATNEELLMSFAHISSVWSRPS